jgi:CheY-like chemotaxis protein
MNSLARLLLVDDDPADAKLALLTLADLSLDQHTLVIPDGMQALDWLHARGESQNRPPGQPVAILLDVKMPGLNGFEVLVQIRAAPALRLIPVVMLSASGQERDVRQAYELGANGYLIKSIDFQTSTANLHAFAKFFAVANEPPPGSLRPHGTPLSPTAL